MSRDCCLPPSCLTPGRLGRGVFSLYQLQGIKENKPVERYYKQAWSWVINRRPPQKPSRRKKRWSKQVMLMEGWEGPEVRGCWAQRPSGAAETQDCSHAGVDRPRATEDLTLSSAVMPAAPTWALNCLCTAFQAALPTSRNCHAG